MVSTSTIFHKGKTSYVADGSNKIGAQKNKNRHGRCALQQAHHTNTYILQLNFSG